MMNPMVAASGPVICTIIAQNYLAQARTMTESFLAHHPGGRVFVAVVDGLDGGFDPAQERFITLDARALPIAAFAQMAFRYNVVELCTAVKPFLLEYLLVRESLPSLFYIDSDLYFYGAMTPLLSALQTADVVLTPHLLTPVPDAQVEREVNILQVGIQNLGIIGLKACPDTRAMLRWWQARLQRLCLLDISRGLFGDQRWADLIPAFCEHVAIVRDPGCNAAYWNLFERHLRQAGSQWMVNDKPLVFFHFSGLVLGEPEIVSRHLPADTMQARPELRPLFAAYHRRLMAHGWAECARLPDGNGSFDNGAPIPPVARQVWRNMDGETRWPLPFQTQGADSYFNWLNRDVTERLQSQPALTELARQIYNLSPELRQAFPDMWHTQRVAFLNWFVADGAAQLKLAPPFLASTQARLAGLDPRARSELARTVAALVQRKPLAPLVEDGSGCESNVRRRLYYAIRNPIRRLGLNGALRTALGPRLTNSIYQNMARTRKRRAAFDAAKK